jgi:hypothetical protein
LPKVFSRKRLPEKGFFRKIYMIEQSFLVLLETKKER